MTLELNRNEVLDNFLPDILWFFVFHKISEYMEGLYIENYSCFTDRIWNIGKTYSFGERRISLERIEESARYVTLFIDCSTIGHNGGEIIDDSYEVLYEIPIKLKNS